MLDLVWPCLAMFDQVWLCLAMFDQVMSVRSCQVMSVRSCQVRLGMVRYGKAEARRAEAGPYQYPVN